MDGFVERHGLSRAVETAVLWKGTALAPEVDRS